MTADSTRLVDNVALRRAVAAFAAQPKQRSSLEVLRSCMYGELLLDITGSDAFTGQPFAAGSILQFRGGTGPNGGKALFAYTRNEEIGRLHPPGAHTQSLAQPATGALELAQSQGYAWLYIDPAGPTCALSAAEIAFALRNANNEPLKRAIADHTDGKTGRNTVIDVLRENGPLAIAADDSQGGGHVGVRTVDHPGGTSSIFGFTSGPEVLAANPRRRSCIDDGRQSCRYGACARSSRDRDQPCGPVVRGVISRNFRASLRATSCLTARCHRVRGASALRARCCRLWARRGSQLPPPSTGGGYGGLRRS